MQLGRCCRAYAQKPQSCFLGSQMLALHFNAHQIFFLAPREFKSVVLSCKPIHQVSLCQLRFFLPPNVYLIQLCVIINIVFRPQYTHLFFYTRYAGKASLETMIVLFFLMEMVTKETHKYLCSRVHFQYIRGDKYKRTILWCSCRQHSRDKSDFLYTRQYLRNH